MKDSWFILFHINLFFKILIFLIFKHIYIDLLNLDDENGLLGKIKNVNPQFNNLLDKG